MSEEVNTATKTKLQEFAELSVYLDQMNPDLLMKQIKFIQQNYVERGEVVKAKVIDKAIVEREISAMIDFLDKKRVHFLKPGRTTFETKIKADDIELFLKQLSTLKETLLNN